MTLIVRRGISPQGTLFVARARHSFGGTDCKKCSTAGNNSTGSSRCSPRSCGIFLANFQIHFSTNSATFASLESGEVPFVGKGFTIWSSSANRALMLRQGVEGLELSKTYRNIDIRLPVANSRKMIMLMNLDKSFTFFTGLSSVSSNLSVSSSSREVSVSTVNDSARKG